MSTKGWWGAFSALLARYPRNMYYYEDGAGLTGFRRGEWIEWWRYDKAGNKYVMTGTTRTPEGAGVREK